MPFSIMGTQLRAPLKRLQHHDSLVARIAVRHQCRRDKNLSYA